MGLPVIVVHERSPEATTKPSLSRTRFATFGGMTEERRGPPVRVRVTGLQEAQLPELVTLERRSASLRAGTEIVAPPEPRDERAIVGLRRTHDVRVLEADHETAGYLAWRDEPPGVAVIEVLCIDPELRLYGLGTRLLREIGEKAPNHGIGYAVVECPRGDTTAASFLARRGFSNANPPAPIAAWKAQAATSEPTTELWWTTTQGLGTTPGLPPPEPRW